MASDDSSHSGISVRVDLAFSFQLANGAPQYGTACLKALARKTDAATLAGVKAQSIECFSSCVFLGRQRMMAELKAAQVGQGCPVTVVAEPRIGKTPTAEELATVAGQY